MSIIREFAANATLWVSVSAWVAACVIKMLVVLIQTKRLRFSALITSGGMPSAHSAFVSAMATSVGIYEGFDSPVFAVAAVVATIVMYDAAGVRRAAGRQAKRVNKLTEKMVENFQEFSNEVDRQLKEMLGHSPLEVIAGMILGIILASVEGYIF